MIADFVLILLIALFVFYPERMIPFSYTSLGRLLAVTTIIYYTSIDLILGIFVCVLTMYYYQLDNFEHMLNISEGFLWEMTFTPYDQEVYYRLSKELIEDQNRFRRTNCSKGALLNKGVPVNIEMSEHVFPELKFIGPACNPCDTKCAFSIIANKITLEDELQRQKSSRI